MRRLYALLAAACCAPHAHGADVLQLAPNTLAPTVSRHKRMVVIMHDGASAALFKFQPWLFALTTLLPRLPIGRIDVSGEGQGVRAAFKVSGTPAIKMFLRDNPSGKRIVDYQGPLEFDALLSWCRAVVADKDHEHSAAAYEPPEHTQTPSKKPTNKLQQLPPSVRAMAETMVREQRLQRILREQGGGMAEKYEELIAARYQQLITSEGTDTNDKFATQEVNRRARDLAREELLQSAPADIREEVEEEVHLGDAASVAGAPTGSRGPK